MSTAVIVENVHIFNGSTDRLSTSSNVLEVGNVIKTSSSAPIADLLLVDGDPLENIKLVEDPAKNFLVIMKDGKLYKNLLL